MAHVGLGLPEQYKHRECKKSGCNSLQRSIKTVAGDWIPTSSSFLVKVCQLLKRICQELPRIGVIVIGIHLKEEQRTLSNICLTKWHYNS